VNGPRVELPLAARLSAERPALALVDFDRIDGRPELGFLIRPFRAAGERIGPPHQRAVQSAGPGGQVDVLVTTNLSFALGARRMSG
jgi:hypothetical protein